MKFALCSGIVTLGGAEAFRASLWEKLESSAPAPQQEFWRAYGAKSVEAARRSVGTSCDETTAALRSTATSDATDTLSFA